MTPLHIAMLAQLMIQLVKLYKILFFLIFKFYICVQVYSNIFKSDNTLEVKVHQVMNVNIKLHLDSNDRQAR